MGTGEGWSPSLTAHSAQGLDTRLVSFPHYTLGQGWSPSLTTHSAKGGLLPSLRIWPREIPFPHYTLGRGSSPSLTAQSAQGGPPVPSPGTTLCHNTSSSCDPGQPTHVALLVLHEDTTHIKMNVHGNHSLEWRACSFICWFLCHVAGE